jgi:hypothetical protein
MKIYYFFKQNKLFKIHFEGHFENKVFCIFITFLKQLFILLKEKFIIKYNKNKPNLIIEIKKDFKNNEKFLILLMYFFNNLKINCKENILIILIYK